MDQDAWDRLSYTQLVETVRSLTTGFIQMLSVLIVGAVTVTGFAVNRQSWGLIALGLIFDFAYVATVNRYQGMVGHLLRRAEGFGTNAPSARDTAKALADVLVQERDRLGLIGSATPIVWTVIGARIVAIVVFATFLDWSFAGS